MGLRFRKSLSFNGFRINFSKTGIGYSYGIKGFRKTKKATGGSRSTISIPGTGISYVKDSKTHKNATYSKNSQPQDTSRIVENHIDNIQSEFAKKLQTIYFLRKLLLFFLIVSFICLILVSRNDDSAYNAFKTVLLIISLICCVILLFFSGRIKMIYSFNNQDNVSTFFSEKLVTDFLSMCSCQVSAQLFETRNNNNDIGVSKNKLIAYKNSSYIKSNVPICQARTRRTKIILLPDCLVVFTDKKFHSIPYSDLTIDYTDVSVPLAFVPADSEVIRQRYQRETKRGQRDMRYKDNPMLNVCAFGGIHLQSNNGLDFSLIFSNQLSAKAFACSVNEYKNILEVMNKEI